MQTRPSVTLARARLIVQGIPLGRAEMDRHIVHTVGFAIDPRSLPDDACFAVAIQTGRSHGVVSRIELREDNGPALLSCELAPASTSVRLPLDTDAIRPLPDGVARFDLRLI